MPSLFPTSGQTLKIFSRKLSLQIGLYCSPRLAQNSKRSKNRFSRETVSMEFDSRLEIKCRPEYYVISVQNLRSLKHDWTQSMKSYHYWLFQQLQEYIMQVSFSSNNDFDLIQLRLLGFNFGYWEETDQFTESLWHKLCHITYGCPGQCHITDVT